MRLIFCVAALLVWTGLQAQNTDDLIVHAPNVQKRSVGEFHGVHVSGGIDLVIKQGTEQGVAISATDVDVRDRVVTRVENGILEIYLDEHGFQWSWSNKHIKAFVSCTTLDELGASGASDIYVDGSLHSDNLSVHLSGSSDFRGAVNAGQLDMNQSGSSDSDIKGAASSLHIHLSGSSDFKGYDMVTDHCSVAASGSSDVQVTVNTELSVSSSGSCDVMYKGNAVVKDIHSSGSSSISHKS